MRAAQDSPGVSYADGYDTGYRDGENNREADAVVYHEEVVGHPPVCNCPLGAFLRHINASPVEHSSANANRFACSKCGRGVTFGGWVPNFVACGCGHVYPTAT